jgi:hypothetical protein
MKIRGQYQVQAQSCNLKFFGRGGGHLGRWGENLYSRDPDCDHAVLPLTSINQGAPWEYRGFGWVCQTGGYESANEVTDPRASTNRNDAKKNKDKIDQ